MAVAQTCPTGADMARGVEVTYEDGTRSVITRDASGVVHEAEYWDGDTPYIYIAANGVLETGYIDPDTGAADSFTYTFPTDDLLPLKPWTGRQGEQITTDTSGNQINRIPFHFRTRDLASFSIGDCTFDAMPIETYYQEPGDPSMVEFIYLIDLGIPINVGYSYLTGGIGSAEPTKPVQIRPVPAEE